MRSISKWFKFKRSALNLTASFVPPFQDFSKAGFPSLSSDDNKLQKLEDALVEQMLTAADLADRGDWGELGELSELN